MYLVRWLVSVLILAVAAPTVLAQAIPRSVRLSLVEAVVQIIPYDTVTETTVNWSGSGTIISPDGYVLTNFHVAGDLDSRSNYEWFAIFTTQPEFTDQPPKFSYWARYIAGDPTHDLAVLHIEEYADETPVPAGTRFPAVAVGDSNTLIPGDLLTIVGYPGISGSTVTFTAGLMSGWVGEDFDSGGKQWIKTDGKIAHGNSGGGAFDLEGNLIGVPTAGRTLQYDVLDVEQQAYVRPIALAWALLGPNVPTVARAGGSSTARSTPTTQSQTQTQTPVAVTPQTPGEGALVLSADCLNCTVGALRLGGDAIGTITTEGDGAAYHTYTVVVPEGASTFRVSVEADGDLDLALKFGSQIESYISDGDWDYMDSEATFNPVIALDNPRAGVWYIDVFNQLDGTTANYTLTVR